MSEPLLTPREHQVLQLIIEGLTNKAIALRLDITAPMVNNHMTDIYDRLGIWKRRQPIRAITVALRRGEITL